MALQLRVLPETLAVCRLNPDDTLPAWAVQGSFWCAVRTREELSLVCAQDQVPAGVRAEDGWRALQVLGPLDFSLTGILAGLAGALAAAGVSIFAISTFDTDYLLVKASSLSAAVEALRGQGHTILAG